MSRTLAALACALVLCLTACGRPSPRDQLERMGIEFTTTNFLAAAEGGDLHVVRLFLAGGMTPNGSDERRHTVLAAAAKGGDAAVVVELLAAGADPNVGDAEMQTPLRHAAAGGHVEVVRLLLDRGANVDSLGADGMNVLTHAARNGHADVARVLVEHRVDLDHGDQFGGTPLAHAATAGHADVVAVLLEGGADPDRRNRTNGAFALGLAAEGGFLETVRRLADAGADLERYDLDRQWTALAAAAHAGHAAEARLLADRGARLETRGRDGNTPLLLAARAGHGEVLADLLARGADPDARDRSGTTALMMVALNGDEASVRRLLGAGADPTLEAGGYSSLTAARREGHEAIARLLARAAAEVRADRGDVRRWARFALYADAYRTPRGWTSLDPMTADADYRNEYSSIGIDPGEGSRTRRALLREEGSGSQILLVRGPAAEWLPRVEQRTDSLEASASQTTSERKILTADGVELEYRLVESLDAEGVPGRWHLLGVLELGDEVLLVDAGGPADSFDAATVERFLGSMRLQPDTTPAKFAPGRTSSGL